MPDLFISYSRRDKDFIQKLHGALSAAGYDIWVDWEDIPPTTEWKKEIERGVESANTFIFSISPSSVQSKACREEIDLAVASNKRLVPIVFIELKDAADFEKLHPDISATNWIFFNDASKFDDSLKTLLDALSTDYDYVREHARLLVKARDWERGQRENDYLLRGEELEDATAWLAMGGVKKPPPTQLHADYVIASQKAQNRYERVRFLSLAIGLAITMILLALALLGFRRASNEADQRATSEVNERNSAHAAQTSQAIAERRASEVRSLAWSDASGSALANENVDLAILLALEANTIQPPLPEAQKALAAAAYSPASRREFRHTDSVTALATNPDGTIAYLAGRDGRLGIWDINTGQKLAPEVRFGSYRLTAITLSPDAQSLAIGNARGEIILYNPHTAQEILRWDAHSGNVNALIFVDDGRLVSAGRDGKVTLWNVENGAEIRQFVGHSGTVGALALDASRSRLVSGGMVDNDHQIILWNLNTGARIATQPAHADLINSLAFSPNGNLLLSAADDTTVKLWSITYRSNLPQSLTFSDELQHDFAVKSASFSPDSRSIVGVTVAPDQSVSIWDVETGQLLRRLFGHTASINTALFLPNNIQVLSGSDDLRVILWDVENGALIQRYEANTTGVRTVAYTPDGLQFLSAGRGRDLSLFDLATGQLSRQFSGHSDSINTLAISGDGIHAATGSEDGRIIIWDIANGTALFTLDNPTVSLTKSINSVAFSPNGRILIAGSQDKTIAMWDVPTGTLIRTLTAHSSAVKTLAFSADGNRFMSGAGDGRLILWDTQSGSQIGNSFTGNNGPVASVAFSPDGQTVLAATFRTITLWDLNSREVLRRYEGHRSTVNSVVFSPDGQYFLSGSSDALVILWDVETGQDLLRLSGHRKTVNQVVFNADGTRALSGSVDDTVLQWRIDNVDSLIQWTHANRLVREFTCLERSTFRLDPCIDNAFPTSTPFITLIPSLQTRTPTPTLSIP